MGAISFNLDESLLNELQRHLPLKLFIETGTYRGESLEAVHTYFDECISIELSPEYHAAAQKRFEGIDTISLLLGDSALLLKEQHPSFAGRSTVFWLDAHWCSADNTAGEKSQCPLLEELAAIGSLNDQSVVLIDDARLFLTPPPRPHEISCWPDLTQLLDQFRKLSKKHTTIYYNDVLLLIPLSILESIKSFVQERAFNLLTYADKARSYDSVLKQAQSKDQEISELAKEAQSKDQEIQSKDQEIQSKDQEISELAKEAQSKDQEIQSKDQEISELAKEAQSKDQEISELAKEAQLRLDVIHRLEADRIRLRASAEKHGQQDTKEGPSLADEVISLRSKLFESQRQIKHVQAKLHKSEIAASKADLRKLNTIWSRYLTRWQRHLASRCPYPLAKLHQHAPRLMRPERFPRKARLAKWPRICVITPSYQQGRFLERTILSVLDQGYPNLAHGVQDGGSTDASAEIINRHLHRLSHAESTPDNGQAHAIRNGFRKLFPGPNDIMCWLNSDDILMPGALHYIGAYFARHPEVDVVYGHRVIIDEHDQEVGRWFLPQYHNDTLKWFDLVPQETIFWRSHCYETVKGLDDSFQFAMDWDLLLRFEHAGFTLRRLPYFLGGFRTHPEQKTNTKIQSIGEQEMSQLRRRIHERDIPSEEIHKHLDEEINRSAMIEWLHRYGLRW